MLIRKATKWEARMIDQAFKWASYSKDPSTKVGAVIYDPVRCTIVTTGYNGFPRGCKDDPELYADRSRKYPRVVHAETNVIVDAAYQGKSTAGMSLACTHRPCGDTCAGIIIQAGIKHIIHPHDGDDMVRHNTEEAEEMFNEAGVQVVALTNLEEQWKI